jgi:membrane dipeptidase
MPALFKQLSPESMSYRTAILLSSILALGACQPASDTPPDLAEEARRIAQGSIIIDGHVDLPYRLESKPEDVSVRTEGGHFDYPRAREGGLDVPFMSIYTPAALEAEGKSYAKAEELIEIVRKVVDDSDGKFAIATSPGDVRQQFEDGIISLPMGMENGAPIDGDLANLQYFFDRGIRYITLTHSLSNHISDSSFDENKQWGGLSEFGAQVVPEMNRLGIMVDISHVSDEAFWQVLDLTAVPVIASHSSARHFTPGWERNMGDEMIKGLAENGGVIMINFGSAFVNEAANEYLSARWAEALGYVGEHSDLPPATAIKEFNAKWEAEHGPAPTASLDDVLDHFDHVVSLVGVDHVGIGSDYDGVTELPEGLEDVSTFPDLIEGLLRRGYSEADIRKILGENLLRVWDAVEAYAATKSTST